MAEEDLIYGKNRHLFGGIEPSNMISFHVVSSYNQSTRLPSIKIVAALPKETVIEGQTLCTVAGAVIRKKSDGYPKDEFDGELIATITEDGEIFDTNVTVGNTYYYAAFPFTEQGVYNRSKKNRASTTAQTYLYLYGYDIDLLNNDPATRVSYPSDVDNSSFAAASMDFSTGTFNYGDWPSQPGEKFMPRPCMLRFDGTVAEYLNPNNYKQTVDGATSKVTDTAFNGNAMMEWGKIYTHRETVNNVYKFRCSDIPLGDDWDCWSNYDKNNNVIDRFYTPIYSGKKVNNVLRSMSGSGFNAGETTQTDINLATANGEGWYIEVIADRFLLQDLLVMMAKSTNLQFAFGNGRCSSDTSIHPGNMDPVGLFWGSNDQTSGVKVFGMENPWGNIQRRTAGWIFDKGVHKLKITEGTHDGSTVTGYNLTGEGYIEIPGTITGNGFISEMKTLPYGRIPVALSGSSTTYEADMTYTNGAQLNYASVGGHWNRGTDAGPFMTNLTSQPTRADNDTGAAVSYKPLATV